MPAGKPGTPDNRWRESPHSGTRQQEGAPGTLVFSRASSCSRERFFVRPRPGVLQFSILKVCWDGGCKRPAEQFHKGVGVLLKTKRLGQLRPSIPSRSWLRGRPPKPDPLRIYGCCRKSR